MALFGKKKKTEESDGFGLNPEDFGEDAEEMQALLDQLNSEDFDPDYVSDDDSEEGMLTGIDGELAEVVQALNEQEKINAANRIEAVKDTDDDQQDGESADENAEDKELTPEEEFKKTSTELCHRIRLLFPQQMLVGLYHGELSGGDYVDDFCCYVVNGEFIDRDEIPTKCGMSYADMVSREDKLMQAFFRFRKSAEAYMNKPCNGVTITIINNGQVKLDVLSTELDPEGEEERFSRFREIVVRSDPKNLPPRLTKEQSEAIAQKTAETYKDLGTEFFSFLPEAEFKKAYFYCEITDGGAFYHHRMVLEDGTILDGDELYDRFDMDREEAEKNRMEIVRMIITVRQIFMNDNQKPFSTITLTVTSKGEFRSFMGFEQIDPSGEQERLAEWKEHFDGTEVME